MAKSKKDEELFSRLRSLGVRKGTAKEVSDSLRNGGKQGSKPASKAVSDLTDAVAEIQSRISKGPERRRTSGKKAARKKTKASRN
jgi:hypothetical protein